MRMVITQRSIQHFHHLFDAVEMSHIIGKGVDHQDGEHDDGEKQNGLVKGGS